MSRAPGAAAYINDTAVLSSSDTAIFGVGCCGDLLQGRVQRSD
jgi:hypothetical protein